MKPAPREGFPPCDPSGNGLERWEGVAGAELRAPPIGRSWSWSGCGDGGGLESGSDGAQATDGAGSATCGERRQGVRKETQAYDHRGVAAFTQSGVALTCQSHSWIPLGSTDRSPGEDGNVPEPRVLSPRAVRYSWPALEEEAWLNPASAKAVPYSSDPSGLLTEGGQRLHLCGSLNPQLFPSPAGRTSKAIWAMLLSHPHQGAGGAGQGPKVIAPSLCFVNKGPNQPPMKPQSDPPSPHPWG